MIWVENRVTESAVIEMHFFIPELVPPKWVSCRFFRVQLKMTQPFLQQERITCSTTHAIKTYSRPQIGNVVKYPKRFFANIFRP